MLIYTSYPKCWFTRHLHVLSLKLYWTKQADDANKIFYLTLSHFEMRSARKSKENESTSSGHTLTTHPTCRACLLAALAPATTSRHSHNTPNLPRKKTVKTVEQCSFQRHYMTHMNVFYKNIYKTKQASLFDVKFSTSCTFDVQYIEFIRCIGIRRTLIRRHL